ncbi:MAG: SDR family NAD(P)-dependent oxidoreductase [Chloroflexota bacterium]
MIGGGTGIGASVCELFVREGATVAVGDLPGSRAARDLVARLGRPGAGEGFIPVDVRFEDQVRDAIGAAISRMGRIDILVNNAGISGHQGPLQHESVEAWEQVIAVNLRGVFFGMKHVLPHMLERGSGRIVNTASQLAHKPSPLNASYCASKAGVVALTVSVAQEVARSGVTVNAVCPGPTDTPMWRSDPDEDWKAWKIGSLPMRRLGTPEEIAWAYVYLASDEASYCTGQSLSPNGGDIMW